jgi:hypothetical protein
VLAHPVRHVHHAACKGGEGPDGGQRAVDASDRGAQLLRSGDHAGTSMRHGCVSVRSPPLMARADACRWEEP